MEPIWAGRDGLGPGHTRLPGPAGRRERNATANPDAEKRGHVTLASLCHLIRRTQNRNAYQEISAFKPALSR